MARGRQKDPWHFPRGELVDQVFRAYGTGLVRRLALFAPRRKGKTSFVLRDLAPAAVAKRYLPVYASLWANPNAPHTVILQALEEALAAVRRKRVAWQRYLEGVQDISLTMGLATARWRPAAGDPRPAPDDQLTAMGAMFGELVRRVPDGKVLFLLDEAQHLATSERFTALTAALRTALDTLEASASTNLCSFFTGSSRTNLNELLNNPKAPFYRSVEQLVLPDLGKDYAEFVSQQLARIGRIDVSAAACLRAFETLDRSPYHMELLIRELLMRRADTVEKALASVTASIVNDPQHLVRWQGLRALDRQVYRVICDQQPPFSRETLAAFSADAGRNIGRSHVQRAIERLKRAGLVSSAGHGAYRNEDTEFATWLRDRSTNRTDRE